MAELILNWNANPVEEEVSAYRVYLNDAAVQDVTTPQAVIPNVSKGDYKIEVSAINSSGEGPKSDPITATVPLPVPTKPSGLMCVVNVNVTVNVNVNP